MISRWCRTRRGGSTRSQRSALILLRGHRQRGADRDQREGVCLFVGHAPLIGRGLRLLRAHSPQPEHSGSVVGPVFGLPRLHPRHSGDARRGGRGAPGARMGTEGLGVHLVRRLLAEGPGGEIPPDVARATEEEALAASTYSPGGIGPGIHPSLRSRDSLARGGRG